MQTLCLNEVQEVNGGLVWVPFMVTLLVADAVIWGAVAHQRNWLGL